MQLQGSGLLDITAVRLDFGSWESRYGPTPKATTTCSRESHDIWTGKHEDPQAFKLWRFIPGRVDLYDEAPTRQLRCEE